MNYHGLLSEKSKPMMEEAGSSPFKGKSVDDVLSVAESTGVSKPPLVQSTHCVMAHVLGFKFRHYQSPEVTETTPRQLYLTAALLIREDFITLDDLYSHLSPADDDVENKGVLYKGYMASINARALTIAKVSQLALAAPLESFLSTISLRTPCPRAKKPPPDPSPGDPVMPWPPWQWPGLPGKPSRLHNIFR